MKFNKELKNIPLILTQRDNLKNPIYLEPRYYNNKLKKYNIHKADYDDKMYQKVAIAIIKPGLGTITDCLLRGITIVTYTRGQNKEFTENAKILEDNNIGINFSNLASAIDFSLSVIKDKNF